MTAYEDLMEFQRETEALSAVAGRTGWDQETVMPAGAAAQRSEEMAALEAVLHARRCDPRLATWLDALPSDLGQVEAAQAREIRRSFVRATRVPADLARALARVTSLAQGEWAEARANDDFAAFAPRLSEVVSLKRQEAAALSDDGNLYDALLDDYEPGLTATELDAIFSEMRPRLVALAAACRGETVPRLSGTYDEDRQLRLAHELALTFGYDMNRGRIDKAVHPFSSGSASDVRITTRTDPADPFNCLYSTIHEVGHATYEQNVSGSFALSPIGRGASMGVHESQSRIYENQLARSQAFTSWLFGRMGTEFGDFGVKDATAFYAIVNRVAPGYIRTEADEVHYNLHVMMRFDLERALIEGALEVADLETAWNDRFLNDFGIPVDTASNGVLQDVHWSVGLFGYFPTYALGNVYAGCLHAALVRDVSGLDEDLGRGDPRVALDWLSEKLQVFGAMRSPRDTIRHAIGGEPTPGPLLDYLESKFGALYGL